MGRAGLAVAAARREPLPVKSLLYTPYVHDRVTDSVSTRLLVDFFLLLACLTEAGTHATALYGRSASAVTSMAMSRA